MLLKLKDEFKNHVVGFNNDGRPLGQRNDLHILLENAILTNSTYILGMFDEIPTLEEIKAIREKEFQQKQNAKKAGRTSGT